jgi:thioredoxin 1
MQTITDLDFTQQVLESPQPVVVEIGATWCPPCRIVEPILEDLAKQYAQSVRVFHIDLDQSPRLAQQLGVLGAPTTLVFTQGREIQRIIGAQRRSIFEQLFAAL